MADLVWSALGEPKTYLEPFFGSGAVLLARPDWDPTKHVETVNDADGFIANLWRALQHDPEEVARWADWPVNHCVPAGTLIATPSGVVPVENIKVGMVVWGVEKGTVVPTMVTATTTNLTNKPLIRVRALVLTGNHPVWTPDGYIDADRISDTTIVAELSDWGVDNPDLHMIECRHGRKNLDHLQPSRSPYWADSICGNNDLLYQEAIRGAYIAGQGTRQNAPRLLDQVAFGQRSAAHHCSIGARNRRSMAGSGTSLDRGIAQNKRFGKLNRWGRRNSGVQNAAGCCGKDSGNEKRDEIPTRPKECHVWQASQSTSCRKNTASWDWSPSYRRKPKESLTCKNGQVTFGGAQGQVEGMALRQNTQRRTQKPYSSFDHQPKTCAMRRNRPGVCINNSSSSPLRSDRNNSQPVSPQRGSLQRLLPQVRLTTVFNFQTSTGNYFANNILVHNCDLSARKRRLIANEARLLENLTLDDEWFDAKLAGYWIWAASAWIGSGLTSLGQIPHVGHSGKGVHAIGQIPHVGHSGKGVHAIGQRPHVSDSGMGVHAIGQIPHVGSGGMGVQEPYNTNIYEWFRRLSERLRYVRVVCGDWTRVCGGDWQDGSGDAGIFFDPPYSVENRDSGVYHKDSLTVAQDVAKWCLERGARPSYRIVLAGYYEEHEWLLEHGWTAKRWSARGGYSKEGTQGQQNRHRECLFFSPHCAKEEVKQPKLFE